MCLKYTKEMFSFNVTWHSYFLMPWQSFHEKRAKSLEKVFLQLWKCNLFDFIEISGNICANKKNKLKKIETFYIVALLNGTNRRLVDYKY